MFQMNERHPNIMATSVVKQGLQGPHKGPRKLLRQKAHSEEEAFRTESGFGSCDSSLLNSATRCKHESFEMGGSYNYSMDSEDFIRSAVHQNGQNQNGQILPSPTCEPTPERQISQTSSGIGEGHVHSSGSFVERNGTDPLKKDLLGVPDASVERQISLTSSGYWSDHRSLSGASYRRSLYRHYSDISDGKNSIEGNTSTDWGSQDIDEPLNLSNASSVFEPKPASESKPDWKRELETFEMEMDLMLLENVDSITNLERHYFRRELSRPRVEVSDNDSTTDASGTTSILLIPPNNISDIKLEISEDDGALTDTYVNGPDYNEEMHRIKETSHSDRNEYSWYNHHEDLDQDANNNLVRSSTRHLESAHLCDVRASRNRYRRCKSVNCSEAQCLLGWLDKCYNLGHLPDCLLCDGTLHKLLNHNRECPESHCSLPFCRVVRERHQILGRHLSIEEFKGEVSSIGKLSAMEAMSSCIHSLPNPLDHRVKALPLAFLGNFGKCNVLLARLRQLGYPPSQSSTVVIKKIVRRDLLLPALQAIRKLRSDRILRIQDLVEEQAHFIMLSVFVPGMTFQEMLSQREGQWPWQDHYSEVVEAVSFLHQHRILFLNWECANILLRVTPQDHMMMCQVSPCLIITQGSLSLIPEGCQSFQADEALSKTLSPRIAAPEILKNQGVGYSADIWGLGVLFYQLVKGVKPYGKLHHFTWERAREQILKDGRPPDLSGCDGRYIEVLRRALSWKPEERPTLNRFKHIFAMSRRIETEP